MADFVAFGNALPGLVKTVSGNMSREDTAKFLMAQQYKIQDIRIADRKNSGSAAGGNNSGQAGGQKTGVSNQKPAVSSAMARLMAMTKGK